MDTNFTTEAAVTVISALAYTLSTKADFSTVASLSITLGCNLLSRLAIDSLISQQEKAIYQPGFFGENNGFVLPQVEKNNNLYTATP